MLITRPLRLIDVVALIAVGWTSANTYVFILVNTLSCTYVPLEYWISACNVVVNGSRLDERKYSHSSGREPLTCVYLVMLNRPRQWS